jgi:hypothetical protein
VRPSAERAPLARPRARHLRAQDDDGARVLHFFDDGRTIVCSDALFKHKQHGREVAVQRAAHCRWRYLNDKRQGSFHTLEDR